MKDRPSLQSKVPYLTTKLKTFKVIFLCLIISGSEEERKAVHLAFQFSSRTEHELYDNSVVEDIQFRLETEDRVNPGQSFEVTVVVENKSEVTREIKVNLAAVLDFYTGVPAKKMKTYKLKFLLNSRAGKAQIYQRNGHNISETNCPEMLSSFWQILANSLLDVVLLEYPGKSHNLSNLIFMTSSP